MPYSHALQIPIVRFWSHDSHDRMLLHAFIYLSDWKGQRGSQMFQILYKWLLPNPIKFLDLGSRSQDEYEEFPTVTSDTLANNHLNFAKYLGASNSSEPVRFNLCQMNVLFTLHPSFQYIAPKYNRPFEWSWNFTSSSCWNSLEKFG